MEAPLMLTALGASIDLVVDGSGAPKARAALAEAWALCQREQPDPSARTLQIHHGPDTGPDGGPDSGDLTGRIVAGADLDRLLVDVTHRVTWQAIDAGIGSLLMVHAAGLADLRSGAAVVFVAPGGTGKTTICRTLGPGRGYLSDETVGIAEDGTIRPYPKPLSVRRGSDSTGDTAGTEKDEVPPARYGLAPAAAITHVHSVLLLDRRADAADEPVIEPLDLFDAIVGISPESSSLARLPRPLHRLADLLGQAHLVARVRYREASRLGPLVDELIGPVTAGVAR